MRTLFWQFRGPHAGPTAHHFQKHLRDFLARHELAELELGVISTAQEVLLFASFASGDSVGIEAALSPAAAIEGGLPDELRVIHSADPSP